MATTENKNYLTSTRFYHSIIVYNYWMKSSKADQDTLIEYDQMRFILQHSNLCDADTSSVVVIVLGSHWWKSHKQQIWRHHMNFSANYVFSLPSYILGHVGIHTHTHTHTRKNHTNIYILYLSSDGDNQALEVWGVFSHSFIAITSRSTWTWRGRPPAMGQIDLFKKCLYSKYSISYNCVQIKNNYLNITIIIM